MKTPLTSIYGSAGTAVALIPSLLWQLSGRGFRMANSGEELLDLFEERYRLPQERGRDAAFSSGLSDCRGWQ
jgi:hypothetical protein